MGGSLEQREKFTKMVLWLGVVLGNSSLWAFVDLDELLDVDVKKLVHCAEVGHGSRVGGDVRKRLVSYIPLVGKSF